MIASGWTGFWMTQKKSFHEVMKIGTTFFARQLEKSLEIKPGMEIFDYGSGPGFLADYFEAKQVSVTGADINREFNQQSRKNHPRSQYIDITIDNTLNQEIFNTALNSKRFDFIVLLSVVQYFKDEKQVGDVIRLLAPWLKDDGKIVIADVIDPHTSAVADTASLLSHCISNQKLIAFFRFIFYLLLSNYRRLLKNNKLLRLPHQTINNIAHQNLLTCERIDRLTIHSTRRHYILKKKLKGF